VTMAEIAVLMMQFIAFGEILVVYRFAFVWRCRSIICEVGWGLGNRFSPADGRPPRSCA